MSKVFFVSLSDMDKKLFVSLLRIRTNIRTISYPLSYRIINQYKSIC